MAIVRTWNSKNLKISLNAAALTDFNGDVTVESDGDIWELTEGQNGAVERSYQGSSTLTVTLPMMATSPQLDVIETLRQADESTGAGPYPFAMTDTDRNFKLLGQAYVNSMAYPTASKTAPARNVVLKVISEAEWRGA